MNQFLRRQMLISSPTRSIDVLSISDFAMDIEIAEEEQLSCLSLLRIIASAMLRQ
jgi:hypothetical protein